MYLILAISLMWFAHSAFVKYLEKEKRKIEQEKDIEKRKIEQEKDILLYKVIIEILN